MSDTIDTQRVGFTIIWKIENISLLPKLLQSGRRISISTPVFSADNLNKTCWLLDLEIAGINRDIYLFKLVKCWPGGENCISLDFELSIVSNDVSKVKSVTEKGFWFHKGDCYGTQLQLTSHVLFNDRKILSGDTLTVQCKMWNCGRQCLELGFTLARTRIAAQGKTFTWNIVEFSTLQVNDSKSVTVEVRRDLKLSFTITLNLTYEEKIKINVEANNDETFNFLIIIGIFVQNANGTTAYHSEEEFELPNGNEKWRFPLILDKKELTSSSSLLLPNDVLSLKCALIASKGDIILNEIERTTYGPDAAFDLKAALPNTIESICIEKEVPSSSNSLTNDMRHLFQEKHLADVSLRVHDETFTVHKAILAARSSVFKTMFDTDMKEKLTSAIEIDDIEPDIMRQFLLYVYCGTLEDMRWENASKLYLAAEKYAVLGLKEKCSSYLKTVLSISNVCDILVLSDMMSDEELKNHAQRFIQDNDTEIMISDGWKSFVQKHSQLAVEILTSLYKNVKLG